MPTTAAEETALAGRPPHSHALPASAWMRRHAALLQPGRTLLDVACGHGRHALYFAERGLRVTAADRDSAALASIQTANPAIRIERHDLEAQPWPYPAASFDAVLVCNYLWRPALPQLLATVAADGILLYETFMLGNACYGKPSNPDFLLRSNELLEQLRGPFQIIAFEEGKHRDAGGEVVAMKQYVAARRT